MADSVISTLHCANLFFETLKPWELKKNTQTLKELDVVLRLTLETLRVAAILLQPIIPNISSDLLDKINVGKDQRHFEDVKDFSWTNAEFKERKLGPEKIVLFKRIMLDGDKRAKANK